MTTVPLSASISFRPVDATSAPDLLAVNRACPIESDFTLRFDREPDFFAWPRVAFDSFEYLGFFDDERLIGYALLGYRQGWAGQSWGRWAYIGDLRVLPECRGRGIARNGIAALLARAPLDVHLGLIVVKRGNLAAGHLTSSFRMASADCDRAGVVEVANLLIRPRRDSSDNAGLSVRRAAEADLPEMVTIIDRAREGRLFAPPGELREHPRLAAALAAGQAIVATRGSRLAGLLAWHDFGDVRRATILRYSVRSWPLRAAWRLARRAGAQIAPLPRPGTSLSCATVTDLAAEHDDPVVLNALVDEAMRALSGGRVHLLQMAEMQGQPLLDALRGRCQWRFRSDVWVGWRTGRCSPMADLRGRPPFIDLASL